jgi:hypothetical protein
MKNKWLNIILIICMIIMQRVVIQMSGYEVYQLPFASTLFIFDNPTSNSIKFYMHIYHYHLYFFTFRVMQEKLQPDMVSFG